MPLLVSSTNLSQALENWKLVKKQLLILSDVCDEWNWGAAAATILVETASTFSPIKEYGGSQYFLRNYWDKPKTRKALGNLVPADATNYCGRGFIQLTGRNNYTKAATALGVNIINSPTMAEEPETAAKIFAWYWKSHGLPKLCQQAESSTVYRKSIWIGVRQRINGGLNGWDRFYSILNVLGLT